MFHGPLLAKNRQLAKTGPSVVCVVIGLMVVAVVKVVLEDPPEVSVVLLEFVCAAAVQPETGSTHLY